ncbi:hypothetical protein J3S04_09420 [Streptomyces griseocarneus]|uniref:Uncharacterized protein n=1 Tax=Streptomyces griseocarneus TaxID=51201 RepID=A0ABX7RUC4_9ACTN|nr:hypothetical protein [Streptomyces griseocarneus]QSY51091.1 hypothetical protein J3S04_09420 [Streptomyces griseocarneus]
MHGLGRGAVQRQKVVEDRELAVLRLVDEDLGEVLGGVGGRGEDGAGRHPVGGAHSGDGASVRAGAGERHQAAQQRRHLGRALGVGGAQQVQRGAPVPGPGLAAGLGAGAGAGPRG